MRNKRSMRAGVMNRRGVRSVLVGLVAGLLIVSPFPAAVNAVSQETVAVDGGETEQSVAESPNPSPDSTVIGAESSSPAPETEQGSQGESDLGWEDAQIPSSAGDPVTNDSWVRVRKNPVTPASCDVDYALVMDLAVSDAAELTSVKQSANAFVDALSGTASRVALFGFDQASPAGHNENNAELKPVKTAEEREKIAASVEAWQAGSGRNWDAAFTAVREAKSTYDIVLFVTAGDPDSFGLEGSTAEQSSLAAIEAGIASANQLKETGTRVVTVGVDSIASAPTDLLLRAVSGSENGSDWFHARDYADAAKTLTSIGRGQCAGSIEVEKRVIRADTVLPEQPTADELTELSSPATGWKLDSSTLSKGTLIENQFGSLTADETGKATVPVRFTAPNTSGEVTFSEVKQNGFSPQAVYVNGTANSAVCEDTTSGENVDVDSVEGTEATGGTVTARTGGNISCTMFVVELRASAAALCEAGLIYGVTADGSVYSVPETGGTATALNGWERLYNSWNLQAEGLQQNSNIPTKYGVNGLAMASDGTLYAFGRFYQYDPNYSSTKWNTSIKMMVKEPGANSRWRWLDERSTRPTTYHYTYRSNSDPIAGAIDPLTGSYVWGGFKDGYFQIHEIDISTGKRIVTGRVQVSYGENGDIAFDSAGNLYVVSHSSVANGLSITTVSAANLAAGRAANKNVTDSDAVVSTIPGSIANASQAALYGGQVNGIAVGSDGGLYVGNTSHVYRINPVTAQIVGSAITSNPFSSWSQDLASCANNVPTTLTVQKDLRGNNGTAPQFLLEVKYQGARVTAATAKTPVPGSTILNEKTGPTMVTPGDVFDLSESSTNLDDYESELSCQIDGISGSAGEVEIRGKRTTSGTVTIPSAAKGKNVICTFTNTPKSKGTVAWQKVQKHLSDSGAEYTNLGGSEWQLTGPTGSKSMTVEVKDCVRESAAECKDSLDKDPRKGFFSVTGLAWGQYQLVESKAPAGFQLDSTPIKFTVGESAGNSEIKLQWDLGKIENKMMTVPGLPFTGGTGEHLFLVAAGVLAMVSLAAIGVRHRTRGKGNKFA